MRKQPPRSGTASDDPQVRAYLADLRAALADAEPADRDEVMLLVGEHIEASLQTGGRGAPDERIRAVLESLGPPQSLAANLDSSSLGTPSTPAQSWPRRLGLTVAAAGALSLPLVLVNPLMAAVLAVSSLVVGLVGARRTRGGDRWSYQLGAILGGIATALLLVLALLLVGVGTGQGVPGEPVPASEPPA